MLDTCVLSATDIRLIVEHVGLNELMDEVILTLENTCRDFESADFDIPSRDGLSGANGLIEWMPAAQRSSHATLKVVGYHPDNPVRHQLPTILSIALTVDTDNGHLLGISDATFATAIRTGCASAVASRILGHENSRTLGLIGAGAQALSQMHALSRVFDLQEVLVYDTNNEVSNSFMSRAACLSLDHIDIRSAPLDQVTSSADLLCTATSVDVARGPVFEDTGLKAHVHVNAVGADFPGKTELPISLLQRSFVAVDFLPQAIKEGEAQYLEPHQVGPDLVHLVQGAGQYAANRGRETVFDSTGFALEDHAVIEVLHGYARQLGRGTYTQLESAADDPHNPYAFLATVNGAPNGANSIIE